MLSTGCASAQSAGWLLPSNPALAIDTDYVLAPAGLLADVYPEAALELMRGLYAEERQL